MAPVAAIGCTVKTPAEVAVRCYSSLMSCKRSAEGNHLAPQWPVGHGARSTGTGFSTASSPATAIAGSATDPTYQYDQG